MSSNGRSRGASVAGRVSRSEVMVFHVKPQCELFSVYEPPYLMLKSVLMLGEIYISKRLQGALLMRRPS